MEGNIIEKVASHEWSIKYKEADREVQIGDTILLEQKDGHIFQIILVSNGEKHVLFFAEKGSEIAVTYFGGNDRCIVSAPLDRVERLARLSLSFFFQSKIPFFHFTIEHDVVDNDCAGDASPSVIKTRAITLPDSTLFSSSHDKGGGTGSPF